MWSSPTLGVPPSSPLSRDPCSPPHRTKFPPRESPSTARTAPRASPFRPPQPPPARSPNPPRRPQRARPLSTPRHQLRRQPDSPTKSRLQRRTRRASSTQGRIARLSWPTKTHTRASPRALCRYNAPPHAVRRCPRAGSTYMPMRIHVMSESGGDKVSVQDRRRDSQTARAEASSTVCDSVSVSLL